MSALAASAFNHDNQLKHYWYHKQVQASPSIVNIDVCRYIEYTDIRIGEVYPW